MSYWIAQIVNGLSFGMVLFMISSGLSLIFGLMRIVNIAHGCFYAWGAYLGLVVIHHSQNFLLAVMVGSMAVAVMGMGIQRFLLHRFQHSESSQVVLTIGLTFALADLALWIWGGHLRVIPKPSLFEGSITIGVINFPLYRVAVIAIGVLVAIGLWIFQEKTKVGALVRAGVDDAEMAAGLGINVPLLFTGIFGLGAFLSALGGTIGGLVIGIYPGAEWEILLLAMAVLILGGLGSLKGAFIGSLFVALVDNFGRIIIPELALLTVFGPVAMVLAFKPSGFFGKL